MVGAAVDPEVEDKLVAFSAATTNSKGGSARLF
jgi:hypothetical protein